MRIVGIDPGLTRMGICLVEKSTTNLKLIDSTLIETSKDFEQGERLKMIYEKVQAYFKTHKPDLVAIERPFLTTHNPNTAFGVVQAIGVVNLAASYFDLNVAFFTPAEVKAGVSANGKAGKEQVAAAVSKLLKLTKEEVAAINPRPDATDAIAVAITGAFKPKLQLKEQKGASLTQAQSLWVNALKVQKGI